MTPIAATTSAPHSGLVTLVAAWQRAVKVVAGRRAVMKLADLDDRMLADIGLVRADLVAAAAAPVWNDPTAVLVNRRGSRLPRLFPRVAATFGTPVESPSIVPAADGDVTRQLATSRG